MHGGQGLRTVQPGGPARGAQPRPCLRDFIGGPLRGRSGASRGSPLALCPTPAAHKGAVWACLRMSAADRTKCQVQGGGRVPKVEGNGGGHGKLSSLSHRGTIGSSPLASAMRPPCRPPPDRQHQSEIRPGVNLSYPPKIGQ